MPNFTSASGNMPVTISGVRSFYYSGVTAYEPKMLEAASNGLQIQVKGYQKAVITMAQEHSATGAGWDKVYLDGVEQPNSTAGGTFSLIGVSMITIKGFVYATTSGRWLTNKYTITLE